MGDDNQPNEFADALAAELNGDEAPPVPAPEAPTPQGGAEEEDQPPAPKAEPEGQVPPVEEQKPEGEKAPEGEPANAQAEEQQQPAFATKDDIKSALTEYDQERSQRIETVRRVREEIIEKLYPEGIDKNIYDTNGNVIKTAQDIVDRELLNPRTGEPFTYEEAASWMLNAQQQMNKNIEELYKYAEDIGELNVSLIESNRRVMELHGETLKNLPEGIAEKLAAAYVKTLEFDKTGSYVVKAKIDPVEFYDLALAPYNELRETLAENQRLAEEQKQKDAEAERDERAGLPPQRGVNKSKSNTGDPMLDALLDEIEKED